MKTVQLTLAGLLAVVVLNAQAPVFQWAKGMNGTTTCEGKAISVDAAGNVVTTGVMRGTVDFDPGPGTYILTSAGEGDIFISKLAANGDFIWAKRIGNETNDQGESVDTDADGNVYVTGWFSSGDPVDFDPGPGVFNLLAMGIETYVLKLDAAGNFLWAKSIEGDNTEYGTSLAMDAAGNLFITGAFNSTVDFDGGPGNASLTQVGGPSQSDIFLTKWDAAGNFLWVKQMAGTSAEYPFKLAIDVTGNVLLTGYFNGTTDFDPGAGVSDLISAGDTDIFICKLDNNGIFIWAKRLGSPTREFCYGITSDLSGNVLIATSFAGVFDADPGPGTSMVATAGFFDIVFVKLTAAGDFLWARKLGAGGNDEVYDIETDAAGNVYIGGQFSSAVDFDPGPAEAILVAPNAGNIFISKFDGNGNYIWTAQMKGGYGLIYAMDMNAANEIFATGFYSAFPVDFDPGPGVFNLTPTATDIFVNKISQGGPLPLTLLYFSGETGPKGITLSWHTAQEINTKEFEIEWGDDGRQFKKIALQKATGGSISKSDYGYQHTSPVNGDNYYRLKMVDMDGQFSYSKIITIHVPFTSGQVTIFPNPVTDQLKLNIQSLKKEAILFYLHSVDGKIIASKSFNLEKGNNLLNWNLTSVPAGKYFISLGGDQFRVMPILKQ